jgi:alpha-1,2-mannosyltransferase
VRILIVSILVAASAVVTGVSVSRLPYYDDQSERILPLVWLTALLWALFALSILALRHVRASAVAALVLIGSVAIGGAALLGPPNTSTDSARYAWDGIVQNAGVSPYEYVPADARLEHLRPDWLFPPSAISSKGNEYCPGERIMRNETPDGLVCTAINRAQVPTIYPPTSELLFAAVRAITGPEPAYWPMQVLGLVLGLAVTGILLRALRRSGRDPRWAALWGWSPLLATEGITNSHIDIAGGLLLLVATLLATGGRRLWSGVALGAAIGVKLIPVIGSPALLRRGGWRLVAASVATFLLLYVPYVAASGLAVIGFLPGYLDEGGYRTGSRSLLVSMVVPGPAATIVAAGLIAVTAVLVWRKTDPADPFIGQVVMIGVTLLVVSPRFPWYALLLVPLVAMTGRWEWMAVPLALTERLLLGSVDLARLTVIAAIVLVVVMSLRHPLQVPERMPQAP